MSIMRQEHPVPQFEREKWDNLNGEWEFETDFSNSKFEQGYVEKEHLNGKIIVPFCMESELSGVGIKDFCDAVWYKKYVKFRNEEDERVIFHFGAVDYETTLFVNGKLAGKHIGGYSSFSFDITELVEKGENLITVYVKDDVRSGKQPRGKQSGSYHSAGCDYTRTTGIWQTVWVEYVPENYIKQVKYYPDVKDISVNITGLASGNGMVTCYISFDGKLCGTGRAYVAGGRFQMNIPLNEKHLWEVGEGNLYDVTFEYDKDVVKSYFGLREVCLDGYRFLLNGKSIFQRTVLDQGFYKDGIYTAKDESEFVKDIKLSMDLGFNGARLHQKVFEQRFIYHCDRLGYLVWGEYGNWGLDVSDIGTLPAVISEWCEIMNRDFNSPAIIGWCPFNETWDYNGRKQDDRLLSTIYHFTKEMDTTRPCIDTSGNFHVVTDIYDVHDYEQRVDEFVKHYASFVDSDDFFDYHTPHRQNYKNGFVGKPLFISEYGGIKWDKEEENADAWGYGEAPKTEEEFKERYKGLTECLLKNPKIMGFCYTQLYDIEQETNGLYCYDRTPKFDDMEFFKKVNTMKAAIED